MGSTNFGNQTVGFRYQQPGTAKSFNKNLDNILATGIYQVPSGWSNLISIVAGPQLDIAPHTFVIRDPSFVDVSDESQIGLTVTIQTTTTINFTAFSNSTPYIVWRYTWVDSIINYADLMAVSYGSLLPTDIVLGNIVYVGTTPTYVDYSRQTKANTNSVVGRYPNLHVYQTEPPSNQVTITGGVILTRNGLTTIASQTSPTISNTTLGRNDLVYIADNGTAYIFLGIDTSTPVTPNYSGLTVIAEIHRGANSTIVSGNNIIQVENNYDIALRNIIVQEFYSATTPTTRADGITALDASDTGLKWYNSSTGVESIWGGSAWIQATIQRGSKVFFTSGTWVVLPGVSSIYVSGCASGGNGSAAFQSTNPSYGAGGGGGEWALKVPISVIIGHTLTITIGGNEAITTIVDTTTSITLFTLYPGSNASGFTNGIGGSGGNGEAGGNGSISGPNTIAATAGLQPGGSKSDEGYGTYYLTGGGGGGSYGGGGAGSIQYGQNGGYGGGGGGISSGISPNGVSAGGPALIIIDW